MSEYNIQMNKYNALNVEYDQLYPATKIANVDGLGTALQNKAPAGFGLGERYGVDITGSTGDANNVKYNGWYTTNDSTANLPTKLPYTASKEGTILTAVRGAQVKQTFFDNNYGYIATRLGNADTGVWEEWEYVNPPMVIGTEYRTTERYQRKPVYTMMLPSVALGSAGSTAYIEGLSNIQDVIDYRIQFQRANGETFAVNNWGKVAVVMHYDSGYAYAAIKCIEDCSGFTAIGTFKYTKTTD